MIVPGYCMYCMIAYVKEIKKFDDIVLCVCVFSWCLLVLCVYY